MSSSAGIITVKFAIPDGGKEIRLNFVPNNNIPNITTTWKIDFGDGNGYITGNPDPVKTYANNTGDDIEIEVKFQIISGAMSAIQIHTDSIEYLTELIVGNSILVKNGETYETPDLSWGLNAVFTGDPNSETGTLLDTTYNVTSLYDATTPIGFFQNATRLTTVPSHLISGITNLSNLFNGASVFNQNIEDWDTSSVTNMSYMFSNASAFNQDIGNWDTSNVENMTHMFNEAIDFNQSIGNWNVSKVTDMSYLFSTSNTLAFNQDIGNWDTSSVENMSYMFNSARSFNQNINTKQVTVNGTTYTAWDTSNVTNMSYMFSETLVFDQYIGNWNVSNVTNMSYMFNASSYNQYIGNWNTSNVENMSYMFYNADFNQNISYWNVNQYKPDGVTLTELDDMFGGASVIDENNIYGFSVPTPTYDQFNQPFKPATKTDLEGALTLWYSKANDSNDPNAVDTANTYPGTGNGSDYFGNPNTWNVTAVTDMSQLFKDKTQLNHPDISNWDVSAVTNMSRMFQSASAFNQDIGQWNVSQVINMSVMFYNASAFNQPIGNWNTSEVTSIRYMFENATAFNQPIGNWDVSNVTNMYAMFKNATAFNQNINTKEITAENSPTGVAYTAWDVSEVTDMQSMFNNARVFNQDISQWNVSNVRFMYAMFFGATDFNQNISGWKLKDGNVVLTNMFSSSGITTQTYNGTESTGKLYGFTVPTPYYNEFNQDIMLNGYNPIAIERATTYTDAGAVAASDVTNLTTPTKEINTSVAGTYSVTYNATRDGQTVTRTRTVEVVDTISPVITSNLVTSIDDGETSLGSVSADETVSWSVNNDDDVQVDDNGNVTLKQAANYQTKQTYTYTITATDNSDNTNSVSETVNVVDTIAPVITVLGENTVTVEKGTTYTDAGASADGGETVTTSGTVDTNTVGSYTLRYRATDSAGNTATATRTVEVVDTIAPVITVLGENTVTVEKGTTYTDAGASADGGETVTTSGTVDTNTVGSYTLRYRATDSAGNTATATRTLNVVDTTPPVITSNLFSYLDDRGTVLGSVYANEQVTWSIGTNDDGADVQITNNGIVTLKQPSNYQTKQSYTYTIIATDNVGKENTVTQTVYVEESTPPVITINGDNPATVEKGSTYTDAGATADTGGTVTTSGTVDTNVIGEYTITYSAMHGISKGTATRTVNVVETKVVDNNVVVELSSNAFIYNSSENATTDDKLDFTKSVFQSLYNDVSQPGKAIKVESTEGGIILPGISEEPIMKPIFLYDGSSKTEFTEEEVQDKNIYILTESGQTIKIGTTIITQNSSNYSVTINGVTTTKERGSTFVVGTETFILGSIYIESVVINSNSCACISQSDPLNNAILDDVSASPAKDSTSDSGNSFSILRNAFRRTYYPVQPAKKEIYGDKDASVIVRQRTINETSRTLNAVGLPMSFTNGNDSNLVRRSVQRTRNSGGVPNKVAKRGPFQ